METGPQVVQGRLRYHNRGDGSRSRGSLAGNGVPGGQEARGRGEADTAADELPAIQGAHGQGLSA